MRRPWIPERKKERKRYSNDKLYQSAAWRRLSKLHKRSNPFCVECEKVGVYTPVAITDHVLPVNTHPELSLDWDNLQSLCMAHHNKKTAKET